MGVVLLDTTVLIDILRGRPALERLHALRSRADPPATSAVSVEEVIRGLRPAEFGPDPVPNCDRAAPHQGEGSAKPIPSSKPYAK